ncbi:flagellar basal body-associated FliL family protein [Methyloversatilis sp.]|uniref:flagellar basal body-associated FliL family protein n=1 Tax=Methyloversatilis sp. TaxID=2569862 RepID=UPI00273647D7|nr:flagellar basal body-associated FliL family protein [Methyloversatilis sp.]MDP3577826.1 flagellar basal body-associated FliL family protein [Methyloversatilis sp.]
MATKSPDAEAAPPPKSKKLLLMVVIGVVVLALAAGGYLFLAKKNAAALDEEEEEEVAAVVAAPTGPPTYLPLDNMVVNLADPGGERVAQIGITLELTAAVETDKVKAYLPTIRSDVLLLVSQRTADELLSREGKEKLAEDILAASSRHFGKPVPGAKKDKKAAAKTGGNPVRGVLFSSFIVQ